jgi:hypothetical protein
VGRETATTGTGAIDVGGGRQLPSDVGRDTPDHSTAAPATVARLDVRIGDTIRYRGTLKVCEAEVLEIPNERILIIRRHPGVVDVV